MKYKKFGWQITYNSVEERLDGVVLGASQELAFHGQSVPELKANFEEVVDRYLARCAAKGIPPYRKYSGKLSLRFDPELHRKAFLTAESQGKSLNQWIEDMISDSVACGPHK